MLIFYFFFFSISLDYLINLTGIFSYFTIYGKVIYFSEKIPSLINNFSLLNQNNYDKDFYNILFNIKSKFSVLNFVYFNCKDYCPILLRNSKTFVDYNLKQYVLLTISFDENRDNYFKINKFWINNGSKKNWLFFIINKNSLKNKKFNLPFWYKKTKFGSFTHTNFFLLIDNEKMNLIKIYNQNDLLKIQNA